MRRLRYCVAHTLTERYVLWRKSGIKHVVVSILDPDLRNSGRGIQILEQAGIQVDIGLCSSQVSAFLDPYLGKS